MIRSAIGVLLFAGFLAVVAPTAYAEPALGLRPLQYVETLQKGERKKAFIDVTNPSAQPVEVRFDVQGFKQVDDRGTLSFYADEKISGGILLDYREAEIPARKTLRLFFVVDGTKLPSGDVFAAIFAQTKPEQAAAVPSVRLGTLVMLTNGTPGARDASIEGLEVVPLQIGESLRGEVKIKNTASVDSASGFFPEVKLSVWPFGPTRTVKGPLVYAGNTRTVAFDMPSNQIGIFRVTASYDQSRKEAWVVLVTGVWRWMIVVILATAASVVAGLVWLRRRRSR